MGVSSSSTRETELADERAYIRSLGDRYPLGDAELRKWCWCHCQLFSVASTPPVGQSMPGATLSSLAVWSAVYGDYNPYTRRSSQPNIQSGAFSNPINTRASAAGQVFEAINHVEQHLFSAGLSDSISRLLGITQGALSAGKATMKDPFQAGMSLKSAEEISAFELSYYSIASLFYDNQSNNASPYESASKSQSLEDFMEGISAACGRRGSRAALSKLFAIASGSEGRSAKADATKLIQTAYCLALAASYLKNVAAQMNNPQSRKGEPVRWEDFVPQKSQNCMQSMADSLIESATKHRQGGGSTGGNFGFDYRYPTTAKSASSTANGDESSVLLEEFIDWAEREVPLMGSALPTFLHVLFTFFNPPSPGDGKEPRFPPGVTPLWIPSLTVELSRNTTHKSPTSSFFQAPSSSSFDLFSLSCTSLTLASGRWHRLFSSEANGLSCNRLMHSILGYGGPTIVLIRSKDTSDNGKCGSGVFGAYTFTPWLEESSGFYGNSDCFLFRLGPDPMAVYRPSGGGGTGGLEAFGTDNATSNQESETHNYMYFNPEARSKGYDGLAHGIGFGGTNDLPRLFIDEVLDRCRAAAEDLTYEKGPLLSGLKETNSSASSHFEVEAMEAWGVGTSDIVEEALMARDGQREDAQRRIRQAMKGAKGQFLEDLQAGRVGNKLFQHRDQIRGRDGDCGLDDNEEDEE